MNRHWMDQRSRELASLLGGLGGLGSAAAQGQQQFGNQFAAQAQAFQRHAQRMQAQELHQEQLRYDLVNEQRKSQYDDGDVIDIECEEVKTTKLIERHGGMA